MRASLLTLSLVGCLAAAARADILHVPKDFATIDDAIAASNPGDTIQVASGTYPDDVHVDSRTQLTLAAKGKVRIGGTLGVSLSSEITVTGLQFTGNAAAALVIGFSDTITISKCRFEPAPAALVTDALPFGSVLANATSHVVVDGCSFKGGSSTRLILGAAGSASLFTVSHCRFDHCGDIGIDLANASQGTIQDCSFRGITSDGIQGDSADQVTISHDSFSDIGHDGIDVAGTSLQVDHCKLVNIGNVGISIDGDVSIAANAISDAALGISLADSGTSSVIAGNVLKKSGQLAISAVADGLALVDNVVGKAGFAEPDNLAAVVALIGDGQFIVGNALKGAKGIGIATLGDGLAVMGNHVTGPTVDGLNLSGDDAVVSGNVLLHCGASGIVLNGTGDLLVANQASGSGDFDLLDENAGQNTIDPSNDFGTVGP